MKEIIKIEDRAGIETVNARELHDFLGSKKDFSDWMKYRINQYGFSEETDFTTRLGKSTGGRPSKEYFITIDMAKELSMVENNERGREARRYFIAREKQAKALENKTLEGPVLIASALIEANRLLEEEKNKNEGLQLKANVADQIANAKGLILPADAGKIICGHPNVFIKWCEDTGIFYRRKKGGPLLPRSKYQDHYLILNTREVKGTTRHQAYFTPRGLAWACARYQKGNNLLPFPASPRGESA